MMSTKDTLLNPLSNDQWKTSEKFLQLKSSAVNNLIAQKANHSIKQLFFF